MKKLERKLNDLANGKITVAEVQQWINENFVSVPPVGIPNLPEIPDIDLGDDDKV